MFNMSKEELYLFRDLHAKLRSNLKGNSVITPYFLGLINKRLLQFTTLVEDGANDSLVQFQLTQFVAIVAEEAQKLYGKLEYGDLVIEVKNINDIQST